MRIQLIITMAVVIKKPQCWATSGNECLPDDPVWIIMAQLSSTTDPQQTQYRVIRGHTLLLSNDHSF